jgi:pseudouridine-5'-phosphate glycosidase
MIEIQEEVRQAWADKRPVVALETALVTHGLPYPQNLETAALLEKTVRKEGGVPATIGVMQGILKVGFAPGELKELTSLQGEKIQARSLPLVLAKKLSGGTTVSATIRIAELAGIRVMATGGIGGVHRQAEMTFDISEDLTELSQTPILVVSTGAKAILNLALTVERLETLGVLILGFRTEEFPAFYTRRSGLRIPSVEMVEEIVPVMRATWEDLHLQVAILIANPPPRAKELPASMVEDLIAKALEAAEEACVRGKDLTPFLLAYLEKSSHGKTVDTNIALAESNARLAAKIAKAYHTAI